MKLKPLILALGTGISCLALATYYTNQRKKLILAPQTTTFSEPDPYTPPQEETQEPTPSPTETSNTSNTDTTSVPETEDHLLEEEQLQKKSQIKAQITEQLSELSSSNIEKIHYHGYDVDKLFSDQEEIRAIISHLTSTKFTVEKENKNSTISEYFTFFKADNSFITITLPTYKPANSPIYLANFHY